MKKGKVGASKTEKISCELLTLTYGSIVSQIIKDFENIQDVNQQLEKMGFNIGIRLIDEFLAKSDSRYCSSYREIADTLAKNAFEMFLGVKCEVANFTAEKDKGCSFSLIMPDNPLNDYVELPENMSALNYSSMICGIIKGALSTIQLAAKCTFVKDVLKNDETNEIKVEISREMNQGEEKEKK